MRRFLLIAGLLPLAGCITFGPKPPPQLLTITATAGPAIGVDQNSASAHAIAIDVPATQAALATARVPVQATPTALAYVPNAQWTEPPARLFARLLADTMSARTGRVVLSTAQSISVPSAQLGGELRNFGADATSREAVVTFDAALRRTDSAAIEKRRFEARVPLAVISADTVGPALNAAANDVATQVADWVGR